MRLPKIAYVLAVVIMSCSSDREAEQEEAQRREALQPIDVQTRRAERLEELRVVDEDGIPLPSDLKIAGIDIPKSFELIEQRERKWLLRSSRLSPEAVGKYLELRLFTGSLERKAGGGVRIANAQIKDALEQPRVTISVTPVRGNAHACRMRIEQANPEIKTDRPSEAEVQAKMRAQRRYAD